MFDSIQIFYNPDKYKEIKDEFNIEPDTLNILLYSYRYFLNEMSSNSSDNIFGLLYNKNTSLTNINKFYYPGNDIKNIPIYDIYSKIENHFKHIPNQGCFVCLCDKGGCYHNIKGGIPGPNYLNLKCKSCEERIGASQDERGFINPIKRDNYYRIFKTIEECNKKSKIDGDKYNIMSLDEFKQKYILNRFSEEKGITKSDEEFFKRDTKIIRFISQITYRILNFILYSHLFFARIYTNNKALEQLLPKDMTWVKMIKECWELIKIELNKIGINSIEIFMNYIFSYLFSVLNEQHNIDNYDSYIEFEKKIDELIKNKIEIFKSDNSNFEMLSKPDRNDKLFYYNLLDERYEKCEEADFPFYKNFYYSEYINEDFLLNKLKFIERNKYPLLVKVLENKNTKKDEYSLSNLPKFNQVLNLFNEKYCYMIEREKADRNIIKNDEIYINNKGLIKDYITFYNGLKIKDGKKKKLELSENSKLSDFFIDDNNEIGKSYKTIYYKFIEKQNKEISFLLDDKIEKGIFDENCKKKINIQDANKNEIFIINLPERFSLIQVVFESSYRKGALIRDYKLCNQFEIDLDLIEERITNILLKNKKLFNDTVTNFVYGNENLIFENIDIITKFNDEYKIEKLNLGDKRILYQFYKDNEENVNLFKKIFNDFRQLILYLNNNKILLNNNNKNAKYITEQNKIYDTFTTLNDKISQKFKTIFNEENESMTVNKTTYLFEYYRNILWEKIKNDFKDYQEDNFEDNKKTDIINYFNKSNLIKKEDFNRAIRSFISLFLLEENEKEKKIKNNNNNIVNYLRIQDIWDKSIYNNREFNRELNNIKNLNIKMNQILTVYNLLGEEIDENYFSDVISQIEKEKEAEKEELEQEILMENRNEVVEEKKDEGKEEENEDSVYDDDYEQKEVDDEDDKGRDYV